jgi:hypothetical protein
MPASPSDFVFYHSEGDDKPISYCLPGKKKASDHLSDGPDVKTLSGKQLCCAVVRLLIDVL